MPWLVVLLAILFSSHGLSPAATVQRKLVYHQITGPSDSSSSSPGYPKLCANGNRVVFTLPPSGTGDPATPNSIFVMKPDGTGLQQVDAYTSLVFSGSYADISDDGSKVVSTDSVQIRSCNGDGSGATPLIALDSNEINDLAISGDGTKVFFRIYRNTSFRNTNPSVPIQNGIYVINVNGTGLRQIVGPTQLSALLGLTEDQFAFFGSGTSFSSLRSSNSGGKIVFSSHVSPGSGGVGQHLFGVNLDGSGLRDYFGQLDFLWQSTINADGTKVGYTIRPLASPTDEAGTVNFNGSGRRKLVDSTQSLPGTGGSFYLSRLQLTADGTKLLIGSSGMLFNTDGSGAVPLGLGANVFSSLAYDGLEQATMNSDATKFIYMLFSNGIGFNMLARLDVNPVGLGAAPTLTKPSASPTFVYQGYVSSSTLSVQTSSPVTEVGTRFILSNGFPSASFEPSSAPLNDAGLRGDLAADSIFSTNDLVAGPTAPLGARTVRLKAEVTDVGGKRHATAIDFTPLSVVSPPGFTVSNASVTEGNSGTNNLTFTVNLSFASTIPATVNYSTFDDTAFSSVDYSFTNGTLTFAPGELTKTITVPVLGDTLDEAKETLFLNLSGPTNAIITDGQGVGTIFDNDSPPTLAVNNPVSKKEGSAATPGQTIFVATLSAPSGKTVKAQYHTTNGTAKSGSDYVARSGTLTFAPGEVSKSVTVKFIGDAMVETNENFFFDLSTPINATIAVSRGTEIIINDDPAAGSPTAAPGIVSLASPLTSSPLTSSLTPANMPEPTLPVAGTFNYLGSWKNTTFSTTGALIIDITLSATNLVCTFDLNGLVFGAGDPPALTFTAPLKADGTGSFKLLATAMGDIAGSFNSKTGALTINITNIPGGFLTLAHVDGKFDLVHHKFTGTYTINTAAGLFATGTLAAHVHEAPTVSVPKTVTVTGTTAQVTAKVTTNSGVKSITAKANGNATTTITGTNPYLISVSKITLLSTQLTIVVTNRDGLKTTKIVKFVKSPAAVLAGAAIFPE